MATIFNSIFFRKVKISVKYWFSTFLLFICCLLSSIVNYLTNSLSVYSLIIPSVFMLLFISSSKIRFDSIFISSIVFSGTILLTISMSEIIFNYSIAGYLYEESPMIDAMSNNRYLVSSMFANYNDFSFAMYFYISILWFEIFNSKKKQSLIKAIVMFSAIVICIMIGSRGFILSFIMTIWFSFLLSFNTMKGKQWCISLSFIVLIAVIPILALIFSDNSTSIRSRIIFDYFDYIIESPYYLIFGFGELNNYVTTFTSLYGEKLYDPHNIFLELILTYGLLPFVLLLIIYFKAAYRILFIRNNALMQTSEWYLAPILLTLPVIGAVPSSSLLYYYLQALLIALGTLRFNKFCKEKRL
ncbi:O-antigen ligase family protein [Vibrio breoganii]|uniref:O-antigen ligase family protein n=1 Tax=Vibrio breoganii TaxID=553239 RepID=UPI0021C42380|nr:O-antigen polymerase [Vibrio breoganii]MDN3715931.1 O-antigen polymerase [Vibrio breoganii]